MSVKLLTEHHLEFISLRGGCTGSSESKLIKMPHCLEITCRGSYFYLPQTECSIQLKLNYAFAPNLGKPVGFGAPLW